MYISCKPSTDLCWECQNNNGIIILRTVNCSEEEKAARMRRQQTHIEHVCAERALYREQVAAAKLVAVDLCLGENDAGQKLNISKIREIVAQVMLGVEPLITSMVTSAVTMSTRAILADVAESHVKLWNDVATLQKEVIWSSTAGGIQCAGPSGAVRPAGFSALDRLEQYGRRDSVRWTVWSSTAGGIQCAGPSGAVRPAGFSALDSLEQYGRRDSVRWTVWSSTAGGIQCAGPSGAVRPAGFSALDRLEQYGRRDSVRWTVWSSTAGGIHSSWIVWSSTAGGIQCAGPSGAVRPAGFSALDRLEQYGRRDSMRWTVWSSTAGGIQCAGQSGAVRPAGFIPAGSSGAVRPAGFSALDRLEQYGRRDSFQLDRLHQRKVPRCLTPTQRKPMTGPNRKLHGKVQITGYVAAKRRKHDRISVC